MILPYQKLEWKAPWKDFEQQLDFALIFVGKTGPSTLKLTAWDSSCSGLAAHFWESPLQEHIVASVCMPQAPVKHCRSVCPPLVPQGNKCVKVKVHEINNGVKTDCSGAIFITCTPAKRSYESWKCSLVGLFRGQNISRTWASWKGKYSLVVSSAWIRIFMFQLQTRHKHRNHFSSYRL